MVEENKRYKAGLLRSLWPHGFNVERYTYTLHRITGVILALYLIAHVFEIFHVALGPAAWQQTLQELSSLGIFEKIGLWIIAGSALYHGANGLRLILNEAFGMLLGKPVLPEYPYTPTSLSRNQKIAIYTLTAIVVILWIWAGLYLLEGLGIV
ncbi:MAG: succinate dehydrogenase [Nitrososphaeria archaeon]|jgi:succinate dehydrogenase/fumarate reductase cytochrome b subunit